MPERRSTERKRVLLEAKWDSMHRTHQARVDDVSLGGCFVNTYSPVEIDEQVNLQILTPEGVWLSLRGKVVTYQLGVGFGMSFTKLSSEEEVVLKDLIATTVERSL